MCNHNVKGILSQRARQLGTFLSILHPILQTCPIPFSAAVGAVSCGKTQCTSRGHLQLQEDSHHTQEWFHSLCVAQVFFWWGLGSFGVAH